MREAMDLTLDCQCANELPGLDLNKISRVNTVRSFVDVLYIIRSRARNANSPNHALNRKFPELGFIFYPTDPQNTLNSRILHTFAALEQCNIIDARIA